jgi:DNA-binding NtrC family response regulator
VATVLLVESDPLQALLRKSILERQFPDVERVGDAAEALCLVEQPSFARELGLVICSDCSQGIGGPAFVAELHARLPKVPVLVLGNGCDPTDDYTGEWVRFLAKPFTAEELLVVAGQMAPLTARETT